MARLMSATPDGKRLTLGAGLTKNTPKDADKNNPQNVALVRNDPRGTRFQSRETAVKGEVWAKNQKNGETNLTSPL